MYIENRTFRDASNNGKLTGISVMHSRGGGASKKITFSFIDHPYLGKYNFTLNIFWMHPIY